MSAALAPAGAGGGGTFALTSGSDGANGDFGATPVTGVGSSEVGIQSGPAESSYPIELPPAPAGPTPQVSLQYSSASIDGFTSDHNSQASEVGIGWQLNTGSITREYKACNVPEAPGDLCWAGENYQITLNGVTDRLIPFIDGSGLQNWRLEHDPYWKVERLTRSDASYLGYDRTKPNAFAWFQVTTPDGTKYRFGGEVEPGSGDHQYSLWHVPVYNPAASDPCFSLAYRMCQEAWRWNLDRVEDTSGNVTSYFYSAGSNYYNARSGQAGPWTDWGYTSGGYLTRIEYTKVSGAELGSDFRQRVLFGYANRCSGACASSADFVDSPVDLTCALGFPSCTQGSPSFWGIMRLDTITTQIKDPTWTQVRQYQLSQGFYDPDPNRPAGVASSYPKMQLDQIQRAGTNAPQPTKFTYAYLYNRVNYPTGVSPMATARLSTITNEIGGETVFGYGQPEPCAQGTQYNFTDHHLDCFPAFYGVGPLPGWIPFNKWVVTAEFEIDLAGGQPVQATSYQYPGGPSWHYSSSPVLPGVGTTSNPQRPENNWNEFRGFHHVIATDTIGQVATGYRFYQGMDGDRASVANPGAYKSVSIVLSDNTTTVTDANNRAGLEADRRVAHTSGGPMMSRHQTDYSEQVSNGLTTPGTTYNFIGLESWFVAPMKVDDIAGGATPRTNRTTYHYNDYGHADLEVHIGDPSIAKDDWHIDRAFTPVNPATWIHGLVAREITRTGLVQNGGLNLIKTEYMYDNHTNPGTDPGPGTRGLTTTVRRWANDTNAPASYDSTMAYDSRGRLTGSTDGRGSPTTYSYDQYWGAAGSMTVTNALTQPVTTTSDHRFGLPTRITDANNHAVKEHYDSFGRLDQVWLQTEPMSGTETKQYSYFMWAPGIGPAAVKTIQLQSAGVTFNAYAWVDGFGRTIQTVSKSPTLSGNDARTSTSYDGSGNTYRTSAPQDTTGTYGAYQAPAWTAMLSYHQFTYDDLGRVTRDALKTTGDNVLSVNDTSYDGWSWTTRPPVGGDTDYENDANGNLVQVVEHDDTVTPSALYMTKYGYDGAGRLNDIVDASLNHSTTHYDYLGRKTSSTDPDAGAWSYEYDGADNLTSQTDARSKQVFFEYDVLNRIKVKRQFPSVTGPMLASYGYDTAGKGLLANATSYDSAGNQYIESVLAYDARNRPTSRQWTIPAAATGVSGTYKMAYTYDAADHQTSVQFPSGSTGTLGETVTSQYSSVGYPRLLTGSSTYVTGSQYKTTGVLKGQTLGASAITRTLLSDDATLRLTSMTAGSGGSADNLQNLTYTYDDVNNVKSITDGNNGGQRQCFKYDGLNRLKRAFTGTTTTPECSTFDGTHGTNPPSYDRNYTYDPTGNFLTAAGRTYGYTTKPHAPTTVGGDSFAYNENGAEAGRAVGGVGGLLGYDDLNRLTSIAQSSGTSTYTYGADDQRLVRKDGTTVTLYLDGGNYQVRSVNGAAPTTTTYYTLGSQRVAVRKGATLYYELSDQLGSASVTTDSAGANPSKQDYFPFGAPRPGPGNNLPIDETYLGKTLDTATGLIQMGARYYDPGIGRFTSPDSIASSGNPQSLNPFAYSFNNPMTLSDPSGNYPCDDPRNCGPGHPAPGVTVPEDKRYGGGGSSSGQPNLSSGQAKDLVAGISVGLSLPVPLSSEGWKQYEAVLRGVVWDTACRDQPLLVCFAGEQLRRTNSLLVAVTSAFGAAVQEAAWEATGIPDAARCIGDGDTGSCVRAGAAIVLLGAGVAAERYAAATAARIGADTGYAASGIDITEQGLEHVFARHLPDGVLSSGKSVFYDNTTITRLIADADTVAPTPQVNGSMAALRI